MEDDVPALPAGLRSRYRLGPRLGAGGFGEVWSIEDLESGVARALKVVPLGDEPDRALRELQAAQALTGPHVLQVLESAVDSQRAFLVMELAEGELEADLEAASKGGDPALTARVWEALRQVATGLETFRAHGAVHRDLKPQNVLMVQGVAKIADLGLAKGGALETLTATGIVVGTPAYLSPEQARGEPLTPASDAYPLGVMFYRLLEGQLPYADLEPVAVVREVMAGRRLPFRRARTRLSPEVLKKIQGLLDADPQGRPSDLAAWAQDLGPYVPLALPDAQPTRQLGAPVAASPVAAAPEAPPRRRGPRRAFAPAVILVAVAVAFGLAVRRPPDRSTLPAQATPAPSPMAPSSIDQIRLGAQELRSQLEACGALDLLDSGEVVPSAQPPGGALRLTSGDPLAWGELVQRLPALDRAYLWARESGRPEELATEALDVFRALDYDFEALGFPRPFSPFLVPVPEPAATAEFPAALAAASNITRLIPAATPPWTTEVFRTANRAVLRILEVERAVTLLARDLPVTGVPEVLHRLAKRTNLSHFAGKQRTLLDVPRMIWGLPEVRTAFTEWVGLDATMRRFLYALGRALREEPDHSEALAALAWVWMKRLRPAFLGYIGDQVTETLLGIEVTGPAAAFVAARASLMNSWCRGYGQGSPSDLDQRSIALLHMALEGSGRGAAAWRQSVAYRELVITLAADDQLEELQRVILGHIEKIEPQLLHGSLHHFAAYLALIASQPKRMVWTAPEVKALKRSARFCTAAPDHSRSETRSDQANLRAALAALTVAAKRD